MKKFLKKVLTFVLLFSGINIFFVFTIPKDQDNYLCEYNHKVQLIEHTRQPRIILIGGSNVPFGIDSQTIKDSLKTNVVNFGLHGGIGIKYPLEDCLQYIKKGDIVIIQMEYEQFTGSGEGEPETLLPFMIATNWRKIGLLSFNQWVNILLGVPQVVVSNLKRLALYPFIGSFNSPPNNSNFEYRKSGFNEFGDEISHRKYSSQESPSIINNIKKDKNINSSFISWLNETLNKYEMIGAHIIMLPPVCTTTQFKNSYNLNIKNALDSIKHPYAVDASHMVVDDSCYFNTGYHVNNNGILQNSNNIINIISNSVFKK